MFRCVLFDNDGVIGIPSEFFSEWYAKTYYANKKEIDQFFSGPFQDCIIGKRDLKTE